MSSLLAGMPPNIMLAALFVVAGLLFVLLSVAGSIAGRVTIAVPSHYRKASGGFGILLIGAGLTLLYIDSSSANQSPFANTGEDPDRKDVTRTLTVYAKDPIGTPYRNQSSRKAETVKFEADGQWSAIPCDYNSDPNVPKDARCYRLGPNGAVKFVDNNNDMPCRAAIGALIVMDEDQSHCLAAGAQGSFDLKPMQTVLFLMNDVRGLYSDNDGDVTVKLSVTRK